MRHVVVLSLLIAGCAREAPVEVAEPDLALYRTRLLNGVLVFGTLVREQECLMLVDENGVRYGTAWPVERTRWDAAAGRLIVGETSAAPGEEVAAAGGVEELGLHPEQRMVRQPNPECIGDRFLFATGFVPDDRE